MGLGSKVVDLVRFRFTDNPDEIARIRQISVVKDEPGMFLVRILVDVVDPMRVERRRPPLDPMNLISLGDQKLGAGNMQARRYGSGGRQTWALNIRVSGS